MKLLLDMGKVAKLLNESDTWLNVADELHSVVASARLGKKLFGPHVELVVEAKVEQVITQELQRLYAMASIDKNCLLAFKKTTLGEVYKLDVIDYLASRREVRAMVAEPSPE